MLGITGSKYNKMHKNRIDKGAGFVKLEISKQKKKGSSMLKSDPKYQMYLQILREELIPAMGCTEPIAIAYAAAAARDVLGEMPKHVAVGASGSIIKNVKSVIVPNTGGLKGIKAATLAGVVAGDAKKILQVISEVTEEQRHEIQAQMNVQDVEISHIDNGRIFEITVRLSTDEHEAFVRITDSHTHIAELRKDGRILQCAYLREASAGQEDEYRKKLAMASCNSVDSSCYQEKQEEAPVQDIRDSMTVEDIYEFAKTFEIPDLKELLDTQINYNLAISKEGLVNSYGANVGKVILANAVGNPLTKAKALAAAGSDARMSGCELPVVINSGSGNQGITVSVPVVSYGRDKGASEEEIYRAVVLSNLIAIHVKAPIGKLSAYCGAVNAGAGAGAGIAFLDGASEEVIAQTVVNALAVISGVICDGAKASCAAKIASSIDAGILGYQMCQNGQSFRAGDGIVSEGTEATLRNVGRLGRDGMKSTNEEIIKIMMGE